MKSLPKKPKFPFKVSKTFKDGKLSVEPHPNTWNEEQKVAARAYTKQINVWKKEVVKAAFKLEEKVKKLEAKLKEFSPANIKRKAKLEEQIKQKKAQLAKL